MRKTVKEVKDIQYAIDQSSILAITDKNGIIEYVNDKFLEISKYRREELMGNAHWIVNSGHHPPEFFDNLWITIKSGKVWRGEIRNRAKNGGYYWLDTTITPLLDKAETPKQYIAIGTDITKQKELEKQKDEFVAVVSHELKTPVTSLKAFAQVLQRRFVNNGDTQSSTYLSKMNAQIDKLTALIDELVNATKMDAGKIQFHYEKFSFDRLVDEIIEETQRITIHHAIIKKGKSEKLLVGDRERIGQVLTNFISNAIKYSPDADKILVKTAKDKNFVTLRVQDFGIGIPKEKLEHVFERFYRVNEAASTHIPGIGLGLYISSEIIKRQGGTIWAESEEGKGSTFCFTLPLKR